MPFFMGVQNSPPSGDAVHHPMFGDGKVEGIVDNKLTIAFEGKVTKVIREDFITRQR